MICALLFRLDAALPFKGCFCLRLRRIDGLVYLSSPPYAAPLPDKAPARLKIGPRVQVIMIIPGHILVRVRPGEDERPHLQYQGIARRMISPWKYRHLKSFGMAGVADP